MVRGGANKGTTSACLANNTTVNIKYYEYTIQLQIQIQIRLTEGEANKGTTSLLLTIQMQTRNIMNAPYKFKYNAYK